MQHWPEVDLLRGPVCKGNRQGVRTDDVEPRDAMNGMRHGLPEWFDLDRRLTRLQEIPISLQFLSVDLRPGLHEPTLRRGKAPAEAFNRVQGKDRGVVLVIRVKVRAMKGGWPSSANIRMMIPKNRDNSGTALLYIVGPDSVRSGIRRANAYE